MVLGITGGFGCGKSSVLRFFEARRWMTLDADAVCRRFYQRKEPELVECIRKNFGSAVFSDDGTIDRKKLGEELFRAPEKMALVTGVIYPMLTAEVDAAISSCRRENRHGALEIPLLYEAGFEKKFDRVLAVWCPPELRKERLLGRNFSPEEVDRRDRRQMPPEEKLERADLAVINSGSPEMLTRQLEKIAEVLEKE